MKIELAHCVCCVMMMMMMGVTFVRMHRKEALGSWEVEKTFAVTSGVQKKKKAVMELTFEPYLLLTGAVKGRLISVPKQLQTDLKNYRLPQKSGSFEPVRT